MIKLSGGWANKTNDGVTYVSFPLSYSANLLIFPNKYKKNEKDPDYVVYLAEKKRNEQQAQTQNGQQQQQPAAQAQTQNGFINDQTSQESDVPW